MLLTTETEAVCAELRRILESTRLRREMATMGYLGQLVQRADRLRPRLEQASDEARAAAQQTGNPEHAARLEQLITDLARLQAQASAP